MKITVTGDFNNELKIHFSIGIWKSSIHPLFGNFQVYSPDFPNVPGIFNLVIIYNSNQCYFENVLYTSNPNKDELSFHFYKEVGRVFCKMASNLVLELNKEIVLNPNPIFVNEFIELIGNKDEGTSL